MSTKEGDAKLLQHDSILQTTVRGKLVLHPSDLAV